MLIMINQSQINSCINTYVWYVHMWLDTHYVSFLKQLAPNLHC